MTLLVSVVVLAVIVAYLNLGEHPQRQQARRNVVSACRKVMHISR